MSETPIKKERMGSIRRGNTINAVVYALSFEIPEAWVRWYEENEAHPNLHLTPAELDAVKETEGDWDREFALVVNAILPFDQCIAQVGNDGWGLHGISYVDLHVRPYVLKDTTEEIEERARSRGSEVVASFAATPSEPQQEQVGAWRRTLIKYSQVHTDYGATAIVDLRIRTFGNRTIVFAFMYTDHKKHDTEIDKILNSVIFSNQ